MGPNQNPQRRRTGAAAAVGVVALLLSFAVVVRVHAATASPTPVDANAIATDAKLTPSVRNALLLAASDYNAAHYDAAASEVATAKSVAGRAYDTFQADNIALRIALARSDYAAGAVAAEEMAASPAFRADERQTVFDNGLLMNAGAGHAWRAIQFGELLDRNGLLVATTSDYLAKLYLDYGAYADGERVAQAALDRATNPAQRKTLSDTLAAIQVKEGKREPSFVQGLLSSVFAGAAAGFAEGLTGQQINNQPPNAAQREAAAQESERQAQQRAAAELLAQHQSSLRTTYQDLFARAAQASATERKRAKRLMQAASDAYGHDDYATAQSTLADVLAIEPTNGTANYYLADCLARRTNDSLTTIDYLGRALAFGNDDDRSMARQALQGIASSQQDAGQN